ncbi:MAG: ABC transporter ATP-binding protein [Solobacterium sp.]|nr:ABC transporter ATP-binding protein [Solobacterium sp.]
MLKAEQVSKSFGDTAVLRDLTIEIPDKTIFGLVGINGAGKSTFLRLAAGVYQPDQGRITLNGQDTLKEDAVRKDISFVADEAYYPLGATLGSVASLYESMYDFDNALFETYCGMFELNRKTPMANYSKGMRRRASIILALCTHPKLLLLDEAYDGLEPLARLQFKRILAQRLEEEEITVVISSHNLRELEDICDSFGILENGTIQRHGDLLESKGAINKYQMAFEQELTKEDFKGLDILRFEKEGRVIQMVVRGEERAVMQVLQEHQPLFTDVLPVTFEEMFLYELEQRGDRS